jgi:hydrogenase maturation protease
MISDSVSVLGGRGNGVSHFPVFENGFVKTDDEDENERGFQSASAWTLPSALECREPNSAASPDNQNPTLLVIGYGNTLRGDDGVGPRVVEDLAAMNLPGVRTLACQLLTPELAEPIAQAGVVVFVDAAVDTPEEVQWRKLEPNETSQLMAHAADPRTMLALARDVFGRVPEAWWLTIPAIKLDFSEEFSPKAQRGCDQAVNLIRKLFKESKSPAVSER